MEFNSKNPNSVFRKSHCCELEKDKKTNAEKAEFVMNCRCCNLATEQFKTALKNE
jgi:hypothetical protein